MNINRHNYEEFFLLYIDNELSDEQKAAVEAFVAQNPDLRQELEMFKGAVLPSDHEAEFLDKEILFRTQDQDRLVNPTNYESWFVQYADDELNNEQKAATEEFVYAHPEYQAEFELIQAAKLSPDMGVIFPDKASLYRSENERKPVIGIWVRYMAAAAVLLVAGLLWLKPANNDPTNDGALVTITEETPAQTTSPVTNQPTAEGTVTKEENILAGKRNLNEPTNVTQQTNTKESRKEIVTEGPRQQLIANNDPTKERQPKAMDEVKDATVEPVVEEVVVNEKPTRNTDQPVYVETNNTPNVVYVNNAADDDYIYVSNTNISKKTPLRGIFRKAGRFIDHNNPLSTERKKGGVFTASKEAE